MWEVVAGIVAIIMLAFSLSDRYKEEVRSFLRRYWGRFLCKVGCHKWKDKTYRAGEVDFGNLPPEGLPKRICVRCGLKEY